MAKREINMTCGNLWKQIMVFSLPLMLSNVLQVLFNMADIAVVGRFAGTEALGAVGSSTQPVFFFTAFALGMGGGVNALVARFLGAREEKQTEEIVHTACLVCGILGMVLLASGELLTGPALRWMGTQTSLLEGAKLYMRIYFLGIPAVALFNFGNGVMSAVGDTKRPLIFLLTAGVLNLILNLVFVIALHKDVDGVAWASVISQYISAFLIMWALMHNEGSGALRVQKLKLHPRHARQLLLLGIPAGFQYAIFAVANMFIQSGVNCFDATFVAGNAAENNLDNLTYDILAAFYTATSSFVAQNFGAGNRERIRKSYQITMTYALLASAVMGIVYSLFGSELLGLFTKDPAVVEAGLYRLRILAASYWLSVLMDNATAACRGLGKSLVPTVVVICGSCVFRIIWIYTIFAFFKTPNSLYLLYVFSWLFTAVAQNVYFVRCYRKQTKLFQ